MASVSRIPIFLAKYHPNLQKANKRFLPNIRLENSHLCLELKVDIMNLFPVWMTQISSDITAGEKKKSSIGTPVIWVQS